MDGDDITTRSSQEGTASLAEEPVVTLTIASHPNPARVGDRALLGSLCRGHRLEVSRLVPDFAPPGRALGLSIGTPFVSRTPFVLSPQGHEGVTIEARGGSVRVNGQPIDDQLALSPRDIETAATIELGNAVVLLLHLSRAADEPGVPRYGLIGDSHAISAVRQAIAQVADLPVPVLLRGESGTGKELVARAIHESGPRRRGPFVGVNLGAVTPTLAAAELFGTVKGAYTGADSGHAGFFQAAHGGTLFLDEVGDSPIELQTMLLRAIESGEYFAVGSRVLQRADVRLVAATDSDLEARARAGDFKEPLLHRLAAYEIWVPALRDRRDDIGRLLVHFTASARAELGEELPLGDDSAGPWIAADLAARLCRYRWPGNVRQLKNVVWQLVIDGRGKTRLESSPRIERMLAEVGVEAEPADAGERPAARRKPAQVTEAEVRSAMAACRWDVAEAVRRLGISRPSLYELMRRSGRLRTAEGLGEEEIEHALEAAGGDADAAAERLQVSARALRRRARRLGLASPR